MNTIVQNILVFAAVTTALVFLFRKFIWKPKKKVSKACGNDECGCH